MLFQPLPDTSQTAPWERATARFDQWRGACIGIFADAEAIVTRTLLALARSPERFGPISQPLLVGPRFDEITRAIGAHAAFAGHGRHALKKLAEFRKHDGLRRALCHGEAEIALDRHGGWVAVIRTTALRPSGPEYDILALASEQTSAHLKDLQVDCAGLACALGHIRKRAETDPSP